MPGTSAAVYMLEPGVFIEDSDSSEYVAPLQTPHFIWDCSIPGRSPSSLIPAKALINHGSSLVMIDERFTNRLGLQRRPLTESLRIRMAVGDSENELKEWVKIKPYKKDMSWCLKSLRAVVAPNLCTSLLLDGPFLAANSIVLDHSVHTAIDKIAKVDILSTNITAAVPSPKTSCSPRKRALQILSKVSKARAKTLDLLEKTLSSKKDELKKDHLSTWCPNLAALVLQRIEELSIEEQLEKIDKSLQKEY